MNTTLLRADLSLGTIDESYLADDERWKRGYGHYLPPAGHPELVGLICEREQVEAPCVVITAGASMALTCAFAAAERSRPILLPRPFYPAYTAIADTLGVRVAHYDLAPSEDDGTIADRVIAASVARDAGALLVNVPGNPLGNVLSRADMDRIEAHAGSGQKLIVIDETYAGLVFERLNADWTGAGASENVVRIRSFSKHPMLAGARIGYIVAPANLAASMRRVHWALGMCPSLGSQLMASRHLRESSGAREGALVDRLRHARDTALDALRRGGVTDVEKPRAGVFLWIPTSKYGLSGSEAATLCAASAKVRVMPGGPFGMENGIRVSFASTPQADVQTVFENLANALKHAVR